MFEEWFPLTSKLLNRLGGVHRSVKASSSLWSRLGPTWYVSRWWSSDSLASMQYSLLCLIDVAHTERLEIQPLVAALADEHRGQYRRRLRLLARRMDGNASLLSALEKTPDALSDNTVLAIRFGTQSGALGRTLEHLIEDTKPSFRPAVAGQKNAKAYWFVLGACMLLLLEAIMYFIAPTFNKLSREFETGLPAAMQALLRMHQFATTNILTILIAFFAVVWLLRSSWMRRFARRQIGDRILGSHSVTLSVQLLRMLAVAVEAGRPLPGALSTLAKYHFDKGTRQRLLLARNEVEQGVPAWNSLVDAKILTPDEFQVLDAAANKRVRSWTLRKMASVKQDWIQSREDRQKAFAHPAFILVFGALLLWICYAFFSILVNMIQQLAS